MKTHTGEVIARNHPVKCLSSEQRLRKVREVVRIRDRERRVDLKARAHVPDDVHVRHPDAPNRLPVPLDRQPRGERDLRVDYTPNPSQQRKPKAL